MQVSLACNVFFDFRSLLGLRVFLCTIPGFRRNRLPEVLSMYPSSNSCWWNNHLLLATILLCPWNFMGSVSAYMCSCGWIHLPWVFYQDIDTLYLIKVLNLHWC